MSERCPIRLDGEHVYDIACQCGQKGQVVVSVVSRPDALPATPPASETERMHVGPPGWDSTAMRPTHVTVTEPASETVDAARPSLVWRQCVCDAWYWGAEQTDSDRAHSRIRADSGAGLDVERLARALAGFLNGQWEDHQAEAAILIAAEYARLTEDPVLASLRKAREALGRSAGS